MIRYKSGFRHQLHKSATTLTEIYPDKDIRTDYIELLMNGLLTTEKGYAWDGPSGPCRWIADRLPECLKKRYLKRIIKGSLFHDALFQLFRLELLDIKWFEQANKEFRRINMECKMSKPRVWLTFNAVQKASASAADPKNRRLVRTAP